MNLKSYLILIWCFSIFDYGLSDCDVTFLDIVLKEDGNTKNICEMRKFMFGDGSSIRQCNIDCQCSGVVFTCCARQKELCQVINEVCPAVIFDLQSTTIRSNTVTCSQTSGSNMMPVVAPPAERIQEDRPLVKHDPQPLYVRTRELEPVPLINNSIERGLSPQENNIPFFVKTKELDPISIIQTPKRNSKLTEIKSRRLFRNKLQETNAELQAEKDRLKSLSQEKETDEKTVEDKIKESAYNAVKQSRAKSLAEIMRLNRERRIMRRKQNAASFKVSKPAKTPATADNKANMIASAMQRNRELKRKRLLAKVQNLEVPNNAVKQSRAKSLAEIMRLNHERRIMRRKQKAASFKSEVQNLEVSKPGKTSAAANNKTYKLSKIASIMQRNRELKRKRMLAALSKVSRRKRSYKN